MSNAMEYLQRLLVSDFMSQDVISVSANSTMAEAAEVLAKHDISGVSVVNELEQCVGILSATDFARRECSQSESDTLSTPAGEYILVHEVGAGPFQIEHVSEDLVRQHMSRALQTIDSQQTLIDAARYMLGEHIHRLVVVDKRARPVGIVSSLDILAALVQAVDEQVTPVPPKN